MTKHVFGNVPFFEHWNFQYTKRESAKVQILFSFKVELLALSNRRQVFIFFI